MRADPSLSGSVFYHVTVNVPVLAVIPLLVVTMMCPVVAPVGTRTTILRPASDLMVALVPLKETFVAPKRWVPLMTTLAPGAPEVGVKLVIFGAKGFGVGVGVGVGVGGVPVTVIMPCIDA